MHVYFIRAHAEPQTIKIGKANSVNSRLTDLRVACAYELTLDGVIQCLNAEHAFRIERALHTVLDSRRVRGEWFRYDEQMGRFINLMAGISANLLDALPEACRIVGVNEKYGLPMLREAICWRPFRSGDIEELVAEIREHCAKDATRVSRYFKPARPNTAIIAQAAQRKIAAREAAAATVSEKDDVQPDEVAEAVMREFGL